ncbi:MAG: tetratricopeptide repeat protein [Candidatus Riflebacteria bacterium]|nr:tetratricopeptide repeat protein [Candidatus Riflebacteria bacterium]
MNKRRLLKSGFLTAAVCLAGLSLSDFKTAASNESIETRIYRKVEIAAEKGRISEAKEDIQRVLKLNPGHTGALFHAGLYSYEAGNFENAEKFFKRVENNSEFGSRARRYLGDMRMARYRKKFKESLEIYITGESYEQALKLCEEAISEMPDNEEILFTAAYAATMLNRQTKAEHYAGMFNKKSADKSLSAELSAFVDAWFSYETEPETALEKFLSISSRRIVTTPVRKRIKDLILKLRLADKFEEFIRREMKVPGADVNSLERELISFLIDQKQYEKALQMVNSRPIDSLDDNLIYVRILSETAQEKKAFTATRQLLSVYPNELRLYDAWINVWLKAFSRLKAIPSGTDEGGKDITEMADEIIARLKPGHLVTINPELLLNMLRVAVIIDNQPQVKLIAPETARINFDDKLTALLLESVDEFIVNDAVGVAANLLESARNQRPDDHNLHIKLAELHLANNPEISAKILESLLAEKPEILRAFLLWVDSLNLSGRAKEAEEAILKRLEEPGQNELVRRQLSARLEVLRMQKEGQNYYQEEQQADQEY